MTSPDPTDLMGPGGALVTETAVDVAAEPDATAAKRRSTSQFGDIWRRYKRKIGRASCRERV